MLANHSFPQYVQDSMSVSGAGCATTVSTRIDDAGWKMDELQGSLFFASAANVTDLFAPGVDPQHVVIEFELRRLAAIYQLVGL